MMYYITFFFWHLFSLLPMRVHYVLSDLIFLIIYHVTGYRKKIVRKNLSSSFPEKSAEELHDIEKRYYHWFCDYLVETVKMFSISEKEMRKRMKFEGMEQLEEDFREGRSVTLYLGHYCNWEWISSLPLHIDPSIKSAQLYHAIENPTFDKLFLYSRGRFHAHSLEMKEAFGILRNWQKEGSLSITGYISDQVPGFSSMHYWPMFLNHDTPAYTGAERIARVLNTTVYYVDIIRPRRGYYVARMKKICTDTKELPKFGITEQYYRMLENSIKRNPEFWLWSHNRWKRTREQFNNEYPEEERKRILSKL